MKTKTYQIIAVAFLSCGILSGCSKDDDTFKGTDNYITSLSLEKEGVKYAASISGNAIELNVPEGIDLEGATVAYKISELAAANPDPAQITAWNNTMQITVTSYNKTPRTYTYTVNRTETVESGTVVLRTQADVNAFAAKGISRIDGNLIFGEAAAYEGLDTIKTISALTALTEVTGNIIIKNSFAAKALDGLKNLRSAGNIYIGTSSSATSLCDSLEVTLPSIEQTGELVVNEPKVKSVALPALRSAWTVFLNTKSATEWHFDALKNIYGDIVLQSGTNATTSTANAKIATAELPALETVVGSLTVQGLVETAALKLPVLKSVGGNMTIAFLLKMEELQAAELVSVGGKITMSNLNVYLSAGLPKLRSIGAFFYTGSYSAKPNVSFSMPQLSAVAGDFEVEYAASETISLENVEKIGGQFKLNYCEQIAGISMPKLTTCPTVYLCSVPKLQSADFSKVTNLDAATFITPTLLAELKLPATIGSLTMNGGSSATSLPSFTGLETITGKLEITNYKATDLIVGNVKSIGTYSQTSGPGQKTLSLPALETIGTLSFSLTDLTTLSAPKLTKAAEINIQNFWALTSVDLSTLAEVTGELKMWGATYSSNASKCQLTDIGFLSSLTKIGSVNIKWWGKLADYSGLANAVGSLSADKWSVTECSYNPTYQNMVDGQYVKP